jgi:CRP-like cAMP-binding protein
MMMENQYESEDFDVPDSAMIRQQVDARMAEVEALLGRLRTEHDQLRRLAATFANGERPAPALARAARPARPPRPNRPAPSATPPRASTGGGRSQQAVDLIAAQPGITAADLAAAMGINRNYLYRVLPRLESRGVIRKRGRGYEPA